MNTIQIIVDEAESTFMIVCNNRDVLKYAQAFTISHLLNKDVSGKDIKDIEYLLLKLKYISSICFDRFIVKTSYSGECHECIDALQADIRKNKIPISLNVDIHNGLYPLAEAIKLIQEDRTQECLRDILKKQHTICQKD